MDTIDGGWVMAGPSYEEVMVLVRQGDRAAAVALVELLKSDASGRVAGWLEGAAADGDWMAATAIASGLDDPDRRRARRDRALRLLSVAKDDDPRALVYLAAIHRQRDDPQAVDLARKAAEAGNADAMGLVAKWLRDTDPEEALFWEGCGREHGDINAMLARAYRLETTDPAEACRLFEDAAATATAPVQQSAYAHLAWLHHRQGDDHLAIRWYERAAGAGSVDSMVNLAGLLFDTDLTRSIEWYRRAAEAGDSRAMVRLASAEKYRDPVDAARWLRRARDLGDDDAEQTLRHFPANGLLRSRLPGWSRLEETKRSRRRAAQRRAARGRPDS